MVDESNKSARIQGLFSCSGLYKPFIDLIVPIFFFLSYAHLKYLHMNFGTHKELSNYPYLC